MPRKSCRKANHESLLEFLCYQGYNAARNWQRDRNDDDHNNDDYRNNFDDHDSDNCNAFDTDEYLSGYPCKVHVH